MTLSSVDPATLMPRPIVLGATGRIGTGFQRLARAGLWPGITPLWQARNGGLRPADDGWEWDILGPRKPAVPPCRGIIGLAGVVSGPVGLNTDLALAAVDLALASGCVPVLLTSTAAVYGHQSGPVDEQSICDPINDYGRAKLAMERAVAVRLRALGRDAPPVCILRIGNVAGADSLLLSAGRGAVILDQFAGGRGPERSYIGMQSLARVMISLMDCMERGEPVPLVLNVAAPAAVRMTDLLQAAGVGWNWQPAPPGAVARMTLDTARLATLVPLEPQAAAPAELVRQARLTGWGVGR